MPKKDKKIKKIKHAVPPATHGIKRHRGFQKQTQKQSIVINIGRDKIAKRRRQYKRKAKENEYISPAVIPPIIQNMLLPTIAQPQAYEAKHQGEASLRPLPFQIEKPASILEQPTIKEQMSSQDDNFGISPEYYTRENFKMIPSMENNKIEIPERQEFPDDYEELVKLNDKSDKLVGEMTSMINNINSNPSPRPDYKTPQRKPQSRSKVLTASLIMPRVTGGTAKKLIVEPGEEIYDSNEGLWRNLNDELEAKEVKPFISEENKQKLLEKAAKKKSLLPFESKEILENIKMKASDIDIDDFKPIYQEPIMNLDDIYRENPLLKNHVPDTSLEDVMKPKRIRRAGSEIDEAHLMMNEDPKYEKQMEKEKRKQRIERIKMKREENASKFLT